MEGTGWGEPYTLGSSSPGAARRDVSAELPVWTNESVKRIAPRGSHPLAVCSHLGPSTLSLPPADGARRQPRPPGPSLQAGV